MVYRIGVDLGGTYVRAGLVSRNKILKYSKIEVKNLKKDIIKAINDVFDSRVKEIGVGMPGPLDSKKGIMINPRNIKAKNFNVKKFIEKEFKLKVLVSNDANCFALAETKIGCAKSANNVVGIISGTGLGAGIIINGKIYSGSNDYSGEIGAIKYKDSILEDYCNASFLKNKFGKDSVELKSKKYYSEYIKHLSFALSIIVNTFDPEIIVLGGGVSKNYKYFLESLKKEMKNKLYKKQYNKLKIKKYKVKHPGIIGATLLFDM